MAKREREKEEKKSSKNVRHGKDKEKPKDSILSNWVKRWIKAIVMFLVSIISVLSFPYFDKAGYAGEIFINILLKFFMILFANGNINFSVEHNAFPVDCGNLRKVNDI